MGSATGPSATSVSPGSGMASQSTNTSGAQARDGIEQSPTKTWQDALAAARDAFGAEVSKIELEPAAGRALECRIEPKSADTKYEVLYSADTLERLSAQKEGIDDAAQERKGTFDPDALIGPDEAAAKARAQKDGAIASWKLEGKDTGAVQYEFDIRTPGSTGATEVRIDAGNGSVIADS